MCLFIGLAIVGATALIGKGIGGAVKTYELVVPKTGENIKVSESAKSSLQLCY